MSMRLSMFFAVLGLLLAAGTLDAAPYQELVPREGHVPVYIREGDTPLSSIHPGLAEAFHEVDGSSSMKDHHEISHMLGDDPNASNTKIEEVAIPPNSDFSENLKKTDDKASSEPNSYVVEAAKEAIKELVSIFESEMLEKLGLDKNEEPVPKTIKDGKPEEKSSQTTEKATDVLTVEAFKAKDFDKKPAEPEEIDIPDEHPQKVASQQ